MREREIHPSFLFFQRSSCYNGKNEDEIPTAVVIERSRFPVTRRISTISLGIVWLMPVVPLIHGSAIPAQKGMKGNRG